MNFSVLLSNNNRSKAYIQNMVQGGFIPSQAIVLESIGEIRPENTENDSTPAGTAPQQRRVGMPDPGVYFNDTEHVLETLSKANVHSQVIDTLDVNSDDVVAAVQGVESDYIVYSGPGGTILRKAILAQGKEFIHVHPGWLPEYRGSTTMYYSLLMDRTVSCSVILMRPRIDAGPILLRKKFQINETDVSFDYIIDPCLRTATLIKFLSNYQECLRNPINQENEHANSFYIIHPVLKHLSILGMRA